MLAPEGLPVIHRLALLTERLGVWAGLENGCCWLATGGSMLLFIWGGWGVGARRRARPGPGFRDVLAAGMRAAPMPFVFRWAAGRMRPSPGATTASGPARPPGGGGRVVVVVVVVVVGGDVEGVASI